MTRHISIGVKAGAEFDALKQNRFRLTRVWSESLPLAAFCLTNPSKAGADLDDPTSIKTQTYGRLWGYGGVWMLNAFSWCATDPKELHGRVESPETIMLNWDHITEAANKCAVIVCGWGRNGLIDGRAHQIRQLLAPWAEKVRALRLLNDGEPEHPLYLPSKLTPIQYPLCPACGSHYPEVCERMGHTYPLHQSYARMLGVPTPDASAPSSNQCEGSKGYQS